MIAQTPTLKIVCDVCEDELYLDLERRGEGLWYDGYIDKRLEDRDWYIVGDTSICPECHERAIESTMEV